ncbi:MAG: acetylornithine aminotransferase [Chloroflexi bacterium]|nr:MAG: acetylornithine aminotransferase [Chloroflexota bacterium]
MNAPEIIQAETDNILQTYVRPDIVFTHGKGIYLFDSNGNKYLDFTAGIAVTSLGHSDPDWVTAVSTQAAQLTHTSNLFHTAPQAKLAKKLVSSSFADKVYFCNSGAEANEAAIKFARKYGKKSKKQKNKIVSFSGGFHGRTMGVLAATHKAQYREPFEPVMPGVTFATYNNLESAQNAINDETCAVIVEPVQGEGGIHPAAPQFLQGVRDLCHAHNALLIFDEVQCGLGRTGHLWAHEAYGVTPDIMTLAKPLAGGLPIGATLVTQAVADVIKPGDHGSTFAAGPLVCTAAITVFDKVSQPAFLEQVRHSSAYLIHQLKTIQCDDIIDIRAAGLLIGVEMNKPVAPIIANARSQGLLIINAGETILRLTPALILEQQHVDEAVQILEKILH